MPTKKLLATAAVALAAAASGTAVAATGPTTITVERVASLNAGDTAPFDVPGVKAIRRGKPIPAGYVLPGQKVTYERGRYAAGATLHFVCPSGKRLQSFATTGDAGFGAPQSYVHHVSALVESFPHLLGTSSGTVYAVCR